MRRKLRSFARFAVYRRRIARSGRYAKCQARESEREPMSVKAELSDNVATAKGTAECRAMTGYAMAKGEYGEWSIRVSVKSVNHRFLEVKLRMPDALEPYELRLRQAVREKVHRGHLDVHVNVEPGKSAPVHVNRELLEAYLGVARELQKHTEAKTELDLVALLG